MSWTFVNSGTGIADSSTNAVDTSAAITGILAGDLIVCGVKFEGGDTTITTASCTGGGGSFIDAHAGAHYTAPGPADPIGCIVYSVAASSGSATIHIVFGASRTFKNLQVYVFRPPSGTVGLDGTPTGAGADDAIINDCSTGAITTVSTDGLAFLSIDDFGVSFSDEKINTVAVDGVLTNASSNSVLAYRAYAAGFTGAGTFDLASAHAWSAGIAAFKTTGGVVVSPLPPLATQLRTVKKAQKRRRPV